MSDVSSLSQCFTNAHLSIQQPMCHVKYIMKVILKATKTKAFKYMTTILICYLIHANIYKNNVFVLRYLTHYISHIGAIAVF